jgi:ABC-type sugar transport system ATPase subunit
MPDTDQPTLLQITRANKSYNGVPALIDAALELQAGEVHALMGENGAGKSTLIKLIAGVTPPDSIQIERRGQPVAIHSPQHAFDHGLRFIHQELNVVRRLSVAENIFLGQPYPTRIGLLVDWRKLNDAARFVLEQIGVTHIKTRELMAHLSTGDQMLVSIARAFAGDDVIAAESAESNETGASVYVMDEPTAALSGEEVALLFGVINRLRERGSAVLYVSHRLEEVFQIADRVTVMRDGRVVATQPIAETTPAELIRQMTGRDLQHVYPPRMTSHGDDIRLEARSIQTDSVRDVNFTLKAGEILGVAGLNGSGRTELLRALMGADRLKAGEIWLDGERLPGLSPSSAWERGIVFVPEERRSQGLIMTRTVGNNVTLPQLRHFSRGNLLLDHRRERQISRDMGESVRLKAEGSYQSVRELSGGNQQKVVFARALTQPPRVMLLDEPTRGVDVGAKYDLYALIRRISEAGTGVIMVSSELPELIGLADRLLIMRDGRLVDDVPNQGLTEEKLLALCYGEIS